MRAYCITIEGDEQSEAGYAALVKSSEEVGNNFEIMRYDAITPDTVEEDMKLWGLTWNYPLDGSDMYLGLKRHAYKSKNIKARMACFMSHYFLWQLSRIETHLILEDDALFVRKLDPYPLLNFQFHVIGINDPRGATRRPDRFHKMVQAGPFELQPPPVVDEPEIPQGLAGASAYLMKPEGGDAAVALAHKHGAWPNDALLCRQLCPWLGVTRTYYTKVQGTPSRLA